MNKDLLTLAKLAKILQVLPKDKKKRALEVIADYGPSGEEIREMSAIRSNGWVDASVGKEVAQVHELCVVSLYISIYGLEMKNPVFHFDNKEIESYMKSIATKPVSQKLHDERMKFLRKACCAYEAADKRQRCLFIRECNKKTTRSKIAVAKLIVPLSRIYSNEHK